MKIRIFAYGNIQITIVRQGGLGQALQPGQWTGIRPPDTLSLDAAQRGSHGRIGSRGIQQVSAYLPETGGEYHCEVFG